MTDDYIDIMADIIVTAACFKKDPVPVRDFRDRGGHDVVTLTWPSGHVDQMTLAHLVRVAEHAEAQGDVLAPGKRVLATRAETVVRDGLRARDTARRMLIDRCQHSVLTTRDEPFIGSVSATDSDERAHGGITEVDVCRCGAERRANVNGRWVEQGTWCAPRRWQRDGLDIFGEH